MSKDIEEEYPENLPELLKNGDWEFLKNYHPTKLTQTQVIVTVPKGARTKLGIKLGKKGGRLACFVNEKEGILVYVRADKYGRILKPKSREKKED